MDAGIRQLVLFSLADRPYALHLSAVERIVPIAAITPLPKAPPIVRGIVNIQGVVVPVIDIRKRFGLPEREICLADHLIVARTARRTVALVADAVSGVVRQEQAQIAVPQQILANLEYVEGVLKLEDGLVLIHDLDTFLSALEEETLDRAIAGDLAGVAG
jgi:purine-binding chemotaxis protein CheW